MLTGITIRLLTPSQTGIDELGVPVYDWEPSIVDNVLIGEPQDQERAEIYALYGKRAAYTLAIPKTDTHDWVGCRVEFFGHTWHVIGQPTKGLDHLVPGPWNMKVHVESWAENGQ